MSTQSGYSYLMIVYLLAEVQHHFVSSAAVSSLAAPGCGHYCCF